MSATLTSSDIEPSVGSTDGMARNSPRIEEERAPVPHRIDRMRIRDDDRDRRIVAVRAQSDQAPAAGRQRHLARALHDVEPQPDVVALAGPPRRGHLERPGSVGLAVLVAKSERHRVGRGGDARRGRVGAGRTSLDDPLHALPRERQLIDARHVEAGVLSGRMRQWPFLSAGDDTRRRP